MRIPVRSFFAFLAVAVPSLAFADVGAPDGSSGEVGEAPGGALRPPCGAITANGCCEGATAFFCEPDGRLSALACGENAHHTVCGLNEGYVDCMTPGAEPGARCSLPPAPPPGETELPDPGPLAGTCPRFPRALTRDPAGPNTCPGAPETIEIAQTGCAFTLTPLSEGATTTPVGQVDGRVVQLSYLIDREPVTCLAAVGDEDGRLSGACDGPWGFEDTACRFAYVGAFSWAPTGPSGGDTTGGETQRPSEGGGGGGGCAAADTGARSVWPLLLFALALAPRTLRRRAR